MFLYHITPTENVPSIKRNGLVPQIGPRATLIGEPEKAVYFFYSIKEVDNALLNWLGEEFGEDEELSLITVYLTDEFISKNEVQAAGYEYAISAVINPEHITGIEPYLD